MLILFFNYQMDTSCMETTYKHAIKLEWWPIPYVRTQLFQ